MKMNLRFNLPVSFIKEGDRFVAYTPALDLSTSGESFKQARARFEEAVDIFFKEVVKKGTLDEVLLDCGWDKVDEQWSPPQAVGQENMPICVGN